MPASLEFLRGLLGILSIFFAHFFGRTIVKVSKGRERRRPLYTGDSTTLRRSARRSIARSIT